VGFVAVYLADLAALAVGALRPEAIAKTPEVALALHDFSWMAPAASALLGTGVLVACSVLALRERMLWPRWIGLFAAFAGAAYALRTGALLTTEGPFAADGLLGFWLPVVALAGWLLIASLSLARRATRP
jgi:drug/metabolite transporter (DMT)-like permease